jgi:hypothetical protein
MGTVLPQKENVGLKMDHTGKSGDGGVLELAVSRSFRVWVARFLPVSRRSPARFHSTTDQRSSPRAGRPTGRPGRARRQRGWRHGQGLAGLNAEERGRRETMRRRTGRGKGVPVEPVAVRPTRDRRDDTPFDKPVWKASWLAGTSPSWTATTGVASGAGRSITGNSSSRGSGPRTGSARRPCNGTC